MAAICGFQFAHIDFFSKAGAKTRHVKIASHGNQRGRGWAARDVLAEAARLEGHCDHVPSPQPPRLVYGCPVMDVEKLADEWIESKRDAVTKRAYRKDAPCMAAGVISFPRDRQGEWEEFLAHSIDALKERYGDRLKSVIDHQDEKHPHAHFYLVARPGEDFGVIHDGYAASRKARKEEGNKVRTRYKEAMQSWQDWVQEKIGASFGLARIGPRLRRLKGHEWKEEQQRRALAAVEKKTADMEAEYAAKKALYVDNEQRLAQLNVDITRRAELLLRNEAALDTRLDNLKMAEVAIAGKMISVEKLQKQTEELRSQNEKAKAELADIFGRFDAIAKVSLAKHQPGVLKILGVENDPALKKITDLGL